MPWVSGKTIFVLSDDNNLFSIRKSDGMIRWKSVVDNSSKSKEKRLPGSLLNSLLLTVPLVVVKDTVSTLSRVIVHLSSTLASGLVILRLTSGSPSVKKPLNVGSLKSINPPLMSTVASPPPKPV